MNRLLLAIIFACSICASGMSAKTRVAVIDLQAKEGVTEGMASLLTDSLRAEIYKAKVFELMNREDMVAILGELAFQQSGACASTTCIVEIGNALGLEKMVAGSAGKFGKMYSITVKLVDISKARNDILLTEYYEGREEGLPKFIQGLAEKVIKREKDLAKGKGEKMVVQEEAARQEKAPAKEKVSKREKELLKLLKEKEKELARKKEEGAAAAKQQEKEQRKKEEEAKKLADQLSRKERELADKKAEMDAAAAAAKQQEKEQRKKEAERKKLADELARKERELADKKAEMAKAEKELAAARRAGGITDGIQGVSRYVMGFFVAPMVVETVRQEAIETAPGTDPLNIEGMGLGVKLEYRWHRTFSALLRAGAEEAELEVNWPEVGTKQVGRVLVREGWCALAMKARLGRSAFQPFLALGGELCYCELQRKTKTFFFVYGEGGVCYAVSPNYEFELSGGAAILENDWTHGSWRLQIGLNYDL